ncbi:aldo-keto reductase [Coccidioides immitis RS]|uniref:D-xylose reductase [NAD(P)H] n=3 Tax=Coccidioides immitis TaxID=5501 RepID=J3KDU0_COCIM|nr:aldo-keto reductase [Coccidioides immitis RS]EAS33564.3 aldo-keto reductase [Coccidioides immitis RS]KMP04744.1 2,5-diketo-D-gluconic acid reductase A [Coccidioides immitis RMSCC 2394]KMU77509.1 2,5-diketo-D-gluconic acid reductase A [Coccidioides immitis RMSCC 3703]
MIILSSRIAPISFITHHIQRSLTHRQFVTMASKLTLQSTYKMNSGYEIPVLGFGVYQTPPEVTEKVTLKALETGYRHIDSAKAYCNEAECGEAIRASGLKREDVFFTTKVPWRSLGYEKTKQSIEESLKAAKVDYYDLILLHAPYGGRDAREGSWRALVEAQKAGKVRSIGVSNYGVHHLDELEEYNKSIGGKIDVGQYEIHPWLSRRDIVEWLRKRNVVVEAYSPLVRAQKMDEPILHELAKKHNKTPAQILVRWSLQKGLIPLPKSVTESRIVENANVFDFELSEQDMKAMETNEYQNVCWDPTTHKDGDPINF